MGAGNKVSRGGDRPVDIRGRTSRNHRPGLMDHSFSTGENGRGNTPAPKKEASLRKARLDYGPSFSYYAASTCRRPK